MKRKIGVFLLIVALGCIGFGVYTMYFLNSPQAVMKKVVSEQLKMLTDTIKENNSVQEKITSNMSVKIAGYEYASLSGSAYADTKNQKYLIDYVLKALDTSTGKSNSQKIQVYFENNKLYFNIGGQLNYIKLSDNQEVFNTKELEALIKIFEDSFENGISKDCYSMSDEKITVNNKQYNTKKYTLKITASDVYKFVEYFLNKVDSSSDVKNFKSILFSSESKDKLLQEFKKSTSGKNSNKEFVNYNVYLDGTNPIRQEIKMLDIEDSESSMVATLDRVSKGGDLYNIHYTVSSDGTVIMDAVYDQNKSVDNISIKFSTASISAASMYTKSSTQLEITGTIKKNNNDRNITLSLYSGSDKTNPLATITLDKKETKKDKEYTLDGNIALSIGEMKIEVSMKNTVTMDQAVPNFNTSGAKEYSLSSAFGGLSLT